MPRRDDLESILIIGAGAIVIGQACEFDYSGVQACKAFKEEGYRVILINSNPATIMTDPSLADATYIEPITWSVVEKIIEIEKPDALIPTMGGQTALNCALDLERHGVLEAHSVEMIGATRQAIDKAEDREQFKKAMQAIGLDTVLGDTAHTLEDAERILQRIGLPAIIRPFFTMGGAGGGIAYNRDEFFALCQHGFDISPTNELLIEECIFGWKEYEMEVVRDCDNNCIVVCSIENFDAMGVHTGDSITVAPAQTLTDKEAQLMRNASFSVLREIGVDTGGSNVQFAVNPVDGRMVVIEMNPRVSRSSALASKATGFPIAKVAAKLAVGYTLDELRNEITGNLMPVSFEPAIDYVVTKIPRFDFVKFPHANDTLTTQMKSVGEVMAIGRTFQESLHKAIRSLEIGHFGFESVIDSHLSQDERRAVLQQKLRFPKADRLWHIAEAFRDRWDIEEVYQCCGIDKWFLAQIENLVEIENEIANSNLLELTEQQIVCWKRKGFADARIAQLLSVSEADVRTLRHNFHVRPVYKRIDSCAAEFASVTAYFYSTYEQFCESAVEDNQKIIVLGGGPNRIGQGIEFDYCCVHAVMALQEEGYQVIMVNCNPETVSTDYDNSDRLYFEPLTLEDVVEIVDKEQPQGVIVQYGGQTPLKLAKQLQDYGVPIIGTSPDAIHRAEDRKHFQFLLSKLGLAQPPSCIATSEQEALLLAEDVGYPLIVRPSYVLGGRAMEIVYNRSALTRYMRKALLESHSSPVLLDRFLNDAIEVDVDAVCDGKRVIIGGILEHIEEAGVHSGDSSCSLPPFSLSKTLCDDLRRQTRELALELQVVGLMNVQFAIQGDNIYVLEVNPRASRTVPFVSKAISRPMAKIAARIMVGKNLDMQQIYDEILPPYYSVKQAIFPFIKLPGEDILLGPEMKSTGEVMGIGRSFGEAFNKSQKAAGAEIPQQGNVLFSVRDEDKAIAAELAGYLAQEGFFIFATTGTADYFKQHNVRVEKIKKVKEGRPHIVDMIIDGEADMVINTTSGTESLADSYTIRHEALFRKVTYFTNIAAARAAGEAHKSRTELRVNKLQDLHLTLVAG